MNRNEKFKLIKNLVKSVKEVYNHTFFKPDDIQYFIYWVFYKIDKKKEEETYNKCLICGKNLSYSSDYEICQSIDDFCKECFDDIQTELGFDRDPIDKISKFFNEQIEQIKGSQKQYQIRKDLILNIKKSLKAELREELIRDYHA